MDRTGNDARRRPIVIGLILLVHLLLGYMLFAPPILGNRHPPSSFVSGSAALGATPVEQAAPPRAPDAFQFSFDQSPLVGPSSRPAPARPKRKVAPFSHPS